MSSLKEDVLNCSKLYSIEATFSSKAWESTGSTEMFPQYVPSAHSQAVRHQQLAGPGAKPERSLLSGRGPQCLSCLSISFL